MVADVEIQMVGSIIEDRHCWLSGYKLSKSTGTSDVKNQLHFVLGKREKEVEKRSKEQIILFSGPIQNSKNM